MAKQVFTRAVVEIKAGPDDAEWTDISDIVCGWDWRPRVGEIQEITLVLGDCDRSIEVVPGTSYMPNRVATASGHGYEPREGWRSPLNDKITIAGVDVSAWCTGYSRDTHVGEPDLFKLHLLADADMLRINGCHPWESQ